MGRLIKFLMAIWRAIQEFRSSTAPSSNGEEEIRIAKAKKAEEETRERVDEIKQELADSPGTADDYADAWDKLRDEGEPPR